MLHPPCAAHVGQAALTGRPPGDARRYNSYLGGPYFNGYNGFSGTVRITLTLAVVPSFQEAVIVNNRVGRGGVSPQARQVSVFRAVAADACKCTVCAVVHDATARHTQFASAAHCVPRFRKASQ